MINKKIYIYIYMYICISHKYVNIKAPIQGLESSFSAEGLQGNHAFVQII